ncbi:M24 family metallopeptidase [Mesorhizobium helmanticense]|uniref:Xaa-Pro aminopeptidase n=1 Tax=Mesorhizobium helmanticense TaxID=1776423 RepID=A0A2T4IZA1_9HYPH|nr:M24 family metallopeptidase [Mesorhizobium helmanticense]PTE10986.1 Xaa-Pro aminopeptidase [Mesorhizobium helmanticense]
MTISLTSVRLPDFGSPGEKPDIPVETYDARARAAYDRAGCDWLAIYADREHFGNIAFLSGFEPRFEEAFLLLGPNNKRVLVTGNECESYAPLARLPGMSVLLAQTLSLMAQDRSRFPRFSDRLGDAGIKAGDTVGLVGWKYLEPFEDDAVETAYFVPAVYVQAFQRAVGASGGLRDATHVLMHPENGIAVTIDADQIAAFEWAALRSSSAMWRIVSGVREGDSEFDAVSRMGYAGDPLNVHTMFASASKGEPVIGLRSATGRKLGRGDGVTTAIGHWGGLSSRAGLLDRANDEFLAIAKGYFQGLISWYETAAIGVEGGAIHEAVTSTLAKAKLKPALNPGHLGGYEEWTHSPIRPGSGDRIRSGKHFQVDIIPTPIADGWALNCEDAVVLADDALRAELETKHPAVFKRMAARRDFMKDKLGVDLRPDILPLSSTPLYFAPFWLASDNVLVRDR